jgi:5-methylcytosine-specific restriction protein A
VGAGTQPDQSGVTSPLWGWLKSGQQLIVDMARTGPTSAVVELVLARSGGVCERCHQRPAQQIHHRCARQAGGSRHTPWINLPSNLAHLCGTSADGCHGYATANRRGIAYDTGWVVPRGIADQQGGCQLIPVVDIHGQAWLLDDDGTKTITRTESHA